MPGQSFIRRKELIEEGDTVMLFVSMANTYVLEVVPQTRNRHGFLVENKFQTVYGQLKVMELVGQSFGTKINLPSGWAYILHPTCELWTKSLPHRTQIIYTPDISLIIFGLNLAPGSVVIEAGTGSGSLSHSLVRAIQPTGHLFTFDFHEKRAEIAREEFEKHGLGEWVTVGHRDVISDGFNVDKRVDAIFLDLPIPWDGIPHAQRTLKRGGRLCTFSPCIEQVQKTCEALKKTQNFIQIQTHEVLQRQLSVQTRIMSSLDFTPVRLEPGSKLAPVKKDQAKFRTLVPPQQMAGHTGYITFATYIL